VVLKHKTWRREDDGRLCFYFSEEAFKEMKVGERIDLVEA